MKYFVTECFEVFGEPIGKKTNTPAKSDLFGVTDSVPLDEDKIDLFRPKVAKLLYVYKRPRVDIDLAISFLFTRVSCTKQKLNTMISKEAEVVGASDYIPWTVLTKWFLEEQDYILRRNIRQ